jgi:hypothetical protein
MVRGAEAEAVRRLALGAQGGHATWKTGPARLNGV